MGLDALSTLSGVGGLGKGLSGIKSLCTWTKGEWSMSHWINRGISDGEAIQMTKDILMRKATSTVDGSVLFRTVYQNKTNMQGGDCMKKKRSYSTKKAVVELLAYTFGRIL